MKVDKTKWKKNTLRRGVQISNMKKYMPFFKRVLLLSA